MPNFNFIFGVFVCFASVVVSIDDGVKVISGGVTGLAKTYKVATVQLRPFFVATVDKGLWVSVLDKLAGFKNFRYELYAYPETEGIWNDLTTKLTNGEIDMILASYGPTESRKKLIDFSGPLLTYLPWVILNKRHQNINSIEDLLNSNLKIGTVKYNSIEELLLNSQSDSARALWRRMSRDRSQVPTVREGIRRARQEDFAFVIDSPIAEYHMNKRPCDLKLLGTDAKPGTYAVAIRKGQSWLKDGLSLGTLFLQQNGFVEDTLHRVLDRSGQCFPHRRRSNISQRPRRQLRNGLASRHLHNKLTQRRRRRRNHKLFYYS